MTEVVEDPVIGGVARQPRVGIKAIRERHCVVITVVEGVDDQDLLAGRNRDPVPVDIAHGLARQHRCRRPQPHRFLKPGLQDLQRIHARSGVEIRVRDLLRDALVLLVERGEQRQAAQRVDGQRIPEREQPVGDLPDRLGALGRWRSFEQAHQAAWLRLVNVALKRGDITLVELLVSPARGI